MERYRYAGIVDVYGNETTEDDKCRGLLAEARPLLGPSTNDDYGIEHHVAIPNRDVTTAVLAIYAAELGKWVTEQETAKQLSGDAVAALREILDATRRGYVQFAQPRDLGVAPAVLQLPIKHKKAAAAAIGGAALQKQIGQP